MIRVLLVGVNLVSDPADPPKIKLLAVSLAYPPLAYPRSIQVARLLRFLDASTVVICADEPGARKDSSIEPDAEAELEACIRVPIPAGRRIVDRLAYRFHRPLWNRRNMAPDSYGAWKPAVLREILSYKQKAGYVPDVLCTFAQPFTNHLIGLELKQTYNLPWVAHFSDPWVDNPFNAYDAHTKKLNLALEKQVVEAANILAFTSVETIDLVLSKYPDSLRSKARLLPQSFDPAQFQSNISAQNKKLTIRYLGNFYGNRTAAPLIDALKYIARTEPEILRDICFELIGISDEKFLLNAGADLLPPGLLNVYPSVEYRESLRLMSEADGLLVIDAPADLSVFLPSKLIDYIGAGRPVFGITPPGTAAELIRKLGGPVVDPADVPAIGSAMIAFVKYLHTRRSDTGTWGTDEARAQFEAPKVAAGFRAILDELT